MSPVALPLTGAAGSTAIQKTKAPIWGALVGPVFVFLSIPFCYGRVSPDISTPQYVGGSGLC